MGMDVYGIKPKNEKGQYFRANVWYWHPLWNCLEHLHPKLCGKVEEAHSNSGDGLGAADSVTLSKLLKKDIESGVIEQYITDYYQYVNSLPLEDCRYCDSLGVRTWEQVDGPPITKPCNVCNGTLKVKPLAAGYHMDFELMCEFQQFLENCGGFRIC